MIPVSKMQRMAYKIVDACKEFGLTLSSIKKTQVMGVDNSSVPTLHVVGKPLQVVNLGTFIPGVKYIIKIKIFRWNRYQENDSKGCQHNFAPEQESFG